MLSGYASRPPMPYERVALPHLTSPYKGEERDWRTFLVPRLWKDGNFFRRGKSWEGERDLLSYQA